MVSTTEPQEEDWDQKLALPAPTVKWGHLVNQLNQDPREDSVANSGWGTASMEEGDADTMGDEEVEEWEGATAGAVPETGAADIPWDPEDPYFKFTDENSSIIQTPVTALTSVSIPTEGTLTGPEELSLEGPQAENPELVSISELIPDYSDAPLVGFSLPELHQVIPWICFEAQSMCKPQWQTELAQIQ